MFELTLTLRYLIPRKKSLSTALISLLSVVVISLVVWLVLVFLSVTAGIERNWLQKLTSLHAPLRITPTERYYSSYYYRIDALSAASGYNLKTIGEKADALSPDPYAEQSDAEIPVYWPSADRRTDGHLRDPVKEVYSLLDQLSVDYQDYEIGGALLRLSVSHPTNSTGSAATLSQMSYLLSLMDHNPRFTSLILPPSASDLESLKTAAANDPTRLTAIKLNVENGVPKTKFDQMPKIAPPWAINVAGRCHLPVFAAIQPLLLPKSYQDMGVRIGDRGSLSFAANGAAAAQEQRIGAQVTGFYDPGLFSLGGRSLIVPSSVTRTIHAASQTFSPDGTPTNGIFVWHDSDIEKLSRQIEERLAQAGLSPYWKVSTYKDYEFSKDLFQQFRSDRTLFLLIAALILLVACCNIISLLVLLVNDKKREIAILQAMGASGRSVAMIFGSCGFAMGALSSCLGTAAAIFTLRHLDTLVALLSTLQGRAAFQPAFFGQNLPNQLSGEAVLFVTIATPLLALLAGLIPALRASRIHPASALRQE